MRGAYYNENDPNAAAWLRELIKQGLIVEGEVDERGVEDVLPRELTGFTQCHFFAGIGVWSYALRKAGWPDNRPVWTGSCPCQPFSAAGKREGVADERHLWPAWFWLIGQCRPVTIFGEQVAKKDGLGWFDLVSTDLEGCGYTVGASVTAACGFGAPHIRQRLYWTAHIDKNGWALERGSGTEEKYRASKRSSVGGLAHCCCPGLEVGEEQSPRREFETFERSRDSIRLGSPNRGECERISDGEGCEFHGTQVGREQGDCQLESSGEADRLAVSNGQVQGGRGICRSGESTCESDWASCERSEGLCEDRYSGSTNGFWRDADWLYCRDGKWRPVMPNSFPLADRTPFRVAKLRGLGNALVAQQATAFVEAFLEIE